MWCFTFPKFNLAYLYFWSYFELCNFKSELHFSRYRIQDHNNDKWGSSWYVLRSRYKPLYVTIKGNLGETKEHECPRNYNPASSVTCAVKDQISIGKFTCLAFDEKKGKNTYGAQITFIRVSWIILFLLWCDNFIDVNQ